MPRIGIRQTAGLFVICFLSKKIRTTNIGKGWSNRNHEKISGQNQTLFEKEIFEKYCPTQFVKTFFKRDFMTV